MASRLFGIELKPQLLVLLGSLSGMTGVYVRNHVFCYMASAGPLGRVELLPPDSTSAVLTWRTSRPDRMASQFEQLELLWGFETEMERASRMWPMRGFGCSSAGLWARIGR